MYRIFILSLLAIVFSTFALEPSQVILRATEIRGDSMVLEWLPIEGAMTYKVLYDEESLINPKAPEPILESPSTDKTHLEIQKMMVGTEYYLVVQGFDGKGVKVGATIPLHASTLRTPVFSLKNAEAIDDQNISLTFSHPIDPKKTQIEIANTETKKVRAIKEIIVPKDDLRIIQIHLEGKLAPDVSHDIVLKKVTDTFGVEMSPELKKTFTVIFSTNIKTTQIPEGTIGMDTTTAPINGVKRVELDTPSVQPDSSLGDLQKKTEELGIDRVEASVPLESQEPEKTPVKIDKLPQTGTPIFMLLGIAILLGAALSYKKKTSL